MFQKKLFQKRFQEIQRYRIFVKDKITKRQNCEEFSLY